MSARLMWELDGRDWPNRTASRFVQSTGLDWHAQVAGAGPTLLLLHGTGSSSHSWRDLFPALSQHFQVIAPDLPGHGFTHAPSTRAYSLSGMAKGVADLLKLLDTTPTVILGHSAGAAIAVRMALDGLASPSMIIGINAALLPYHGSAAPIYAGLAKLMNMTPIVPWAIAMHAGTGNGVERVLDETGSRIDARGISLYRRLAGKAFEVRRRAPQARITTLSGLGHLAHEENPAMIVEKIMSITRDHAIPGVH